MRVGVFAIHVNDLPAKLFRAGKILTRQTGSRVFVPVSYMGWFSFGQCRLPGRVRILAVAAQYTKHSPHDAAINCGKLFKAEPQVQTDSTWRHHVIGVPAYRETIAIGRAKTRAFD